MVVVRLPAGLVAELEGVTTVRVTVLDDWLVEEDAGLAVVVVVVVVAGRVIVVVDDSGAVLGTVGVASVLGVGVVDVPGLAVLVLFVGCAVASLRAGWLLPLLGLAVPVEASTRSGMLELLDPTCALWLVPAPLL